MDNLTRRQLPDEERAAMLARMDAAIDAEQARVYAQAVHALEPLLTALSRITDGIIAQEETFRAIAARLTIPPMLDTRAE